MITTDINEVSDTPRTDDEIWDADYHHKNEIVVDADFARQLERELAVSLENQVKTQAEVERLKELLNRAINEIEKTPFHTPKLTAFTAHRLADRYREKMTNTSTKPIESQEDDK